MLALTTWCPECLQRHGSDAGAWPATPTGCRGERLTFYPCQKAVDPVRSWVWHRPQGRWSLVSTVWRGPPHRLLWLWPLFGNPSWQGPGFGGYIAAVSGALQEEFWAATTPGSQCAGHVRPTSWARCRCLLVLSIGAKPFPTKPNTASWRGRLRHDQKQQDGTTWKAIAYAKCQAQDRPQRHQLTGATCRNCMGCPWWTVDKPATEWGATGQTWPEIVWPESNHFDLITVKRHFATQGRCMQDRLGVLVCLGHDWDFANLDQERRSNHRFTIGLTTEDHTDKRPGKGRSKLRFINIEQNQSKSPIGNKLSSFQVSSSFVVRGQDGPLGKRTNGFHGELTEAFIGRGDKSTFFKGKFRRVQQSRSIRLGGSRRARWMLLSFTLHATLRGFLLDHCFQFLWKDQLERGTAIVSCTFQGSPWLAWRQCFLSSSSANSLNQECGPVVDLTLFNSIFLKQRSQAVSSFGIQASTPNPRTTDCGARVKELNKHRATHGMQLTDFVDVCGQHLAAQHVVQKPQRTNATVLFDSKLPVNHMHCEGTGTDDIGKSLVQHWQTWGRRPRDIPAGGNHAMHSPSPNEGDPMIFNWDQPDNSRRFWRIRAEPLGKQTRAGSFDSFSSEKWVKENPVAFVGSCHQPFHMPAQFIVGPQRSLVGQDGLARFHINGLLAQRLNQAEIRDGRLRDQQQTTRVQGDQRFRPGWRGSHSTRFGLTGGSNWVNALFPLFRGLLYIQGFDFWPWWNDVDAYSCRVLVMLSLSSLFWLLQNAAGDAITVFSVLALAECCWWCYHCLLCSGSCRMLVVMLSLSSLFWLLQNAGSDAITVFSVLALAECW